jgi:phosphoglycerol transferase MdoB-like AlkP superfamily enzyme
VRPAERFAPDNVPLTFLPQNEDSVPYGQDFPMLRTTRAFRGEKIVPVAVPETDRPHVVMVFMESFRAAEVGALGGKYGVTPFFDRLSKEGVLWENFYTNGPGTADAAVSTLYGIPPQQASGPTQNDPNVPPIVGLPNFFARRGYLTGHFDACHLDWCHTGEFFLKHGFHRVFGPKEFVRRFPETERIPWGACDEYVMRFHAEWLAQNEAKGLPTFSTLFTITNHFPWEAPPHTPEVPEPNDPNAPPHKYLKTMRYADWALENYIADLKARGLEKRVVLWIMADTGQHFEG